MLRVEGLEKAIAGLNKLTNGTWVNAPLYEYARYVQAKTAPYPPQRPTTYRRTGTEGRGWYVQQGSGQVTIGNRAPYSGWVQQEATQAWMHKGYWPTVEDKAESKEAEEVFLRAIDRKIRSYFG